MEMAIKMRLLLECSKASVLALVAFIAGCCMCKSFAPTILWVGPAFSTVSSLLLEQYERKVNKQSVVFVFI